MRVRVGVRLPDGFFDRVIVLVRFLRSRLCFGKLVLSCSGSGLGSGLGLGLGLGLGGWGWGWR